MKNKTTNPDHNIWNNNGTYWCHYTVHGDDYTKKRVRVSLGTKDIEIARALRDFIMDATPKIATNIPRQRGRAIPDHAGDSPFAAQRSKPRQFKPGAVTRPAFDAAIQRPAPEVSRLSST